MEPGKFQIDERETRCSTVSHGLNSEVHYRMEYLQNGTD